MKFFSTADLLVLTGHVLHKQRLLLHVVYSTVVPCQLRARSATAGSVIVDLQLDLDLMGPSEWDVYHVPMILFHYLQHKEIHRLRQLQLMISITWLSIPYRWLLGLGHQNNFFHVQSNAQQLFQKHMMVQCQSISAPCFISHLRDILDLYTEFGRHTFSKQNEDIFMLKRFVLVNDASWHVVLQRILLTKFDVAHWRQQCESKLLEKIMIEHWNGGAWTHSPDPIQMPPLVAISDCCRMNKATFIRTPSPPQMRLL